MPNTNNNLAYQPHVDGLRALAILSVVIYHAWPELGGGGFIGVDIFFVISGYLISKIILSELSNNTFSIIKFYNRRIKRIFPALTLVIITTFIFGSVVLMPDEYQSLSQQILASTGFSANLIFMHQSDYFDTLADTKPLLHLWSLGVEEQFYVIWPILVYGICKLKPKWAATSLFVLFFTSISACIYYSFNQQTYAFYSPVTRFWELFLGGLLAYVKHHQKPELLINNNLVASIGLTLLFSGFLFITSHSIFPGFWALLPTLGAFLILLAGGQAKINQQLFANSPMVKLGLISYPLYLWHWPLLSFARIIIGEPPSNIVRFSLVLIALLLAWLTFKFIEKPTRYTSNKNAVLYLVAVMIITGFLSATVYQSNGTKYRLSANQIQSEAFASTKQLLSTERKLCHAKYPDAGLCFSNTSLSKIEYVIFLGDSHVDALAGGFIKYNPKIKASSFMMYGCPPFLGVVRMIDKAPLSCDGHTKQILSLFEHTPNQVFILNARFAMYESGQGFVQQNQQLNEPTDVHLQSIQYTGFNKNVNREELFKKGLSSTLETLKKQHKSVILVYQNPELGFDPKTCVNRPLRRNLIGKCHIDKQLVDSRQSAYRKLISEVLKDYPLVATVDPESMLCDSFNCTAEKNGQILYRDDDHLSIYGSMLMSNAIKSAIFKVKPLDYHQS